MPNFICKSVGLKIWKCCRNVHLLLIQWIKSKPFLVIKCGEKKHLKKDVIQMYILTKDKYIATMNFFLIKTEKNLDFVYLINC